MVPGKGEHPWEWPGDTSAPEPGGERDGSLSIPECWPPQAPREFRGCSQRGVSIRFELGEDVTTFNRPLESPSVFTVPSLCLGSRQGRK